MQLAECLANIVVDCCVYVVVLLSFVGFVFVNGGLVVGDRDAHKPTLHPMQLCYFCLFFLAFSPSYAAECAKPFVSFCRRSPHLVAICFLICTLLVHSNTIAHPFLLADNRHFTFYIWNRLFGKYVLFRYIIIPLYVFGGYVLLNFIRSNSFAFKALFVMASSACLVPQRLLEPRYFILPFLVARLQGVSRSWWTLCSETLYFILINGFTMYIFITKTFSWQDIEEPQRIIW